MSYDNLAWLDLDRPEGLEYWNSMELMGRYASVNHDIIHQSVLKHLGTVSALTLENHHNFAWKMQCGDEEVIVHRKGATPADKGSFVDVVARFDPKRAKMAPPDRRIRRTR